MSDLSGHTHAGPGLRKQRRKGLGWNQTCNRRSVPVNAMLIRFHSPAHHEVLMFGSVGKELLGMLGLSGRVPSAIQAVDIPAARDRLLAALAGAERLTPATRAEDSDSEEDHVPLKIRAAPLLELLDAAHVKETYVMWEEAR